MSIPKLTGRENWSTWSFAVKAYLQHEDLHNCISAEPNPNDPKAVKDDVKAKSKLILLVDPILYEGGLISFRPHQEMAPLGLP